jgi:UDP-GlcNAc:undecaprenyl-phosphate GlcNAc-1-phosphate transferase
MTLFISILLTLFLIFIHKKYKLGSDVINSRKVHDLSVSRLGGIAVAGSFLISIFLESKLDLFDVYIDLILILFVIFVLIEDVKGVLKPSHRLSAIIVCSFLLVSELDLSISNLGVPILDSFLENLTVSILFTTISLSLLANGFNLIDGFNGLTAGFSIMVLTILMTVANEVLDPEIYLLSKILLLSTLGFFILNFPLGKIFLGDAGAYFLGLVTGVLALLLAHRNDTISYWFVLALFIYPVYELVFSMIRRRFNEKTKTSQADDLHLHHLIYKEVVDCSYFPRKEFCNSATSVIMVLIANSSVLPAYIWADNPVALFSICIIFMAIYTSIFLKLK